MVVFVVTLLRDNGTIAGVFSTLAKASEYVNRYPYNGYSVVERTVDGAE